MKSQLDVSRFWGEKNNNPEIPFSFILQKPVSERHRRKALTPSFHLLKSLWLKQSVQMSGMDSVGLSVCRDEGSSHRTGDRDRFGCPQVKQEISGGGDAVALASRPWKDPSD